MKSFSLVAVVVGSLVGGLAGCGTGGGGTGTGGAGGGAGTGGSGGSGGGGSGGTGGGGGGTGGGGADAAGEAAPGIPAGDHFCHSKKMEALQWAFGYDSRCVISEIPENGALPPATVTTMLNNACAYVHGGTVVTSCSRDDVVAYCTGGFPLFGVTATTLVYRSSFSPDAEHVALNSIAFCPGLDIREPGGQTVVRKCKGTVSAKVDGQMVTFSNLLNCFYKTNGTKRHYLIDATAASNANIKLAFISEGGAHGFDLDPLGFGGIGYWDGIPFVLPTDTTARTAAITTFSDRGARLTGTFAAGEVRGGSNMVRTITDGTIDIQITAP
jgi:hypothetical protein